jgi:hypothetical protein
MSRTHTDDKQTQLPLFAIGDDVLFRSGKRKHWQKGKITQLLDGAYQISGQMVHYVDIGSVKSAPKECRK